MPKVLLGDVARERKETNKGDKSGLPIVGLEHLTPEEITLTAWNEDSENTFTKVFHKGDVLFGRRRAYLKKAAVAPFDGICSGDITVIEAIPEHILPELLPFIIQNDALFDFAVEKSAGSLSPRVKWEHLRNYEFELPEMDKQRELAELLWAMDATKKSYQELISATDELVKSQFIEMFGDPAQNPMGWPMRRLSDVCTKLTDGTHFSPESFPEGDYKYITAKNIKIDGFDFSDLTYVPESVHRPIYERCDPEYGDILYIKDGATTGIAMINTLDEEFTMLSSVALLKHDRSIINGQYLKALLNFPTFYHSMRSNMDGAAITRLTIKKLCATSVPVPPIEHQGAFATFVIQSDKSKFEMEQALAELTATYKRIIAENLG